jgi:membrane protease subunit HflC
VFYKAFGGTGEGSAEDHYAKAEKILKTKLRTAASAVSHFRSDELLSGDPKASKLGALENEMLASLKGDDGGASALSTYGIEPEKVGISGLGLPPSATTAVFGAMKSARDKIANSIRVQGTSEASRIKSEADASADKIQKFADQLAKSIKSKGDVEAAQYLGQMKQDPQLAVFIQNMDFLRTLSTKRTTLVLPTWLPGFDMFKPDAAKKFGTGRPPVPEMPEFIKAKVQTGAAEPAPATESTPVAGGSR